MSGGSYDYLCYKMEDAGASLCRHKNLKRKAFGRLMLLCTKAMHDVEWVDSGDMSAGDELEAIDKALKFFYPQEMIHIARQELLMLKGELEEALKGINE